MIELKTAVFLAASLRMGAVAAGAGEIDQENIYAFGKNLGLAFQVQDDWLDSFGDPSTFGKQKGGDILANKKTFLLLMALEKSGPGDKKAIQELLLSSAPDKVERMIGIYRKAGVDQVAQANKKIYMEKAESHLGQVRVPDANKEPLRELARYLLEREN
jgi:geranylgeranyl diphosphate synthase type II